MSKSAVFQKIISFYVIISLFGCSTFQPIEAQQGDLQDEIRHENILKISDVVKIFTEDGKKHQIRITSIDENEIVGVRNVWKNENEVVQETVTIPINSIIGLETPEFSKGKTALLVGGISVFVIAFVLLAVALSSAAFMPN